MSEFSNRMNAQRAILTSINGVTWDGEPLFGLSSKAIGRWVATNALDPQMELVQLIRSVATELFFLGNFSEEQVTEEYALREHSVASIADAIGRAVASLGRPARSRFRLRP